MTNGYYCNYIAELNTFKAMLYDPSRWPHSMGRRDGSYRRMTRTSQKMHLQLHYSIKYIIDLYQLNSSISSFIDLAIDFHLNGLK